MYSHHIEKMRDTIMDALNLKNNSLIKTEKISEAYREIHRALEKYWEDKIAITWCVDDVESVVPDCNKGEAQEILQYVLKKHDANKGVNWDSFIDAKFWLNEKTLKP